MGVVCFAVILTLGSPEQEVNCAVYKPSTSPAPALCNCQWGLGLGAGVPNRSFVVFSVSALVLIFNTKKSYFQPQLKAVAMINVSFLSLSRISTGIQTKLHSKKKKLRRKEPSLSFLLSVEELNLCFCSVRGKEMINHFTIQKQH